MVNRKERARHPQIEEFLAFYDRIHIIPDAYSHSGATHLECARQLYEDSIGFLESLPSEFVTHVLDVGIGYGFHCRHFAQAGYEITGITAHMSKELHHDSEVFGYTVSVQDMHLLDYPNESFDLIWSHHSLEHSFSPLLALREWLRVLRPGGYLAVTVPPHKTDVVSGHFTTGWSILQLMYLLAVAGYDTATGQYIEEGYNVRALVRRPVEPYQEIGSSWLHQIRDRFPTVLQEAIIQAPGSLGRYKVVGEWQRIESGSLVAKPHSLKQTIWSRLFKRLRRAFD